MTSQRDVDIWNSVWQGHWYGKEALRVRRSRQKVACIESFLGKLSHSAPLRVCDVGCGSGYFISEVSRLLPPETSFDGCDQSSSAIESASRTLSQMRNVSLSVRDAAATGFPSSAFDLVFAVCVLEHIEQKAPVIAEFNRIARSDGFIVVYYSSTRSAFHWEHLICEKFGGWKFGFQDEMPIDQLTSLFSPTFNVVEVGTLKGDWDFPLLATIDFLLAFFLRNWGRYHYCVLEKRHG